MENERHTRDEIVAASDQGIIAETFTGGRVASGPGEFTFCIKNGWLVEGGKITAPIKDLNLIGNGPDAQQVVEMARAAGADDAWATAIQGRSLGYRFRDGKPEPIRSSNPASSPFWSPRLQPWSGQAKADALDFAREVAGTMIRASRRQAWTEGPPSWHYLIRYQPPRLAMHEAHK